MKEAKRMGRPLKTAKPGTRVSLGLKVTPETKTRIDEAARRNGRTQSQESEYRLERSFADEAAFPNEQVRFWAAYMANTFTQAGAHAAREETGEDVDATIWMKHADTYRAAVVEVFDALLRQHPGTAADVERTLSAMAGRAGAYSTKGKKK